MNTPEKREDQETPQRTREDQEIPQRMPYSPPRLQRWGTLKEITQGGGGKKGEPSKRLTRF